MWLFILWFHPTILSNFSSYIWLVKFKWTYLLATLCIIALIFILADDSIAQCSMCRKIATDGANSKAVGASLNHGILYLLALPYLLLTFFFRKQIFDFMRSRFSRAKKWFCLFPYLVYLCISSLLLLIAKGGGRRPMKPWQPFPDLSGKKVPNRKKISRR